MQQPTRVKHGVAATAVGALCTNCGEPLARGAQVTDEQLTPMRPSRRGATATASAARARAASASEAGQRQVEPARERSRGRPAARALRDEVVPALQKEFSYTNPMQVPRLTKIVVNIGLGEALTTPRRSTPRSATWPIITGQKPIVTRAKRSIAQFRLRTGNAIGAKVTLRGERMWDFLERLTRLALPRIRDFRGVPGKSFDGRGNYSLGLREQLAFPEIDYDKIDRLRGLEVSIVTTADDRRGVQAAAAAARHAIRRARRRAQDGVRDHGQEITIAKAKRKPQFDVAELQPLLRLRPPARLHAPLRPVPHLLPRARPAGRAAGRDQVELVAR